MELDEFLARKPEGAAVQWRGARAQADGVIIEGAALEPWWEGSNEFEIHCCGAVESQLKFSPGALLGDLSASGSHPLLWDYGGYSSIFGNAPLPDPPRFFHEFYQLVRSELGVPRDPVRYLNWSDHLSQWLEFVYSRTYQLLSAPAPIAEAACELLDVQAAEYTILPDPVEKQEPGSCELLAVSFGSSWVICRSAVVERRSTDIK